MRIVFMGTPQFAVPSLQALLSSPQVEVVAVVTQPDRPVGRKRVLTPTPVKLAALEHGLPVFQPEKLRHPDAIEQLRVWQPDLIVTAAYGQILPKVVLDMPKLGCINVHASLLPKYRGGAPIHYAVMNGDEVTGVTIMYMAEGIDTGDMISRIEVPITDEDTTGTLFDKLSYAGAELLMRTLPALQSNQIKRIAQDDALAVYAPNITREQEKLDWSRPALELWYQVRALHPRPGAFTLWNQEVLKLWRCAKPDPTRIAHAPCGTVQHVSEAGIEVATGAGVLLITELQPAGKKAMSAADFARGGLMHPGTVLGV